MIATATIRTAGDTITAVAGRALEAAHWVLQPRRRRDLGIPLRTATMIAIAISIAKVSFGGAGAGPQEQPKRPWSPPHIVEPVRARPVQVSAVKAPPPDPILTTLRLPTEWSDAALSAPPPLPVPRAARPVIPPASPSPRGLGALAPIHGHARVWRFEGRRGWHWHFVNWRGK